MAPPLLSPAEATPQCRSCTYPGAGYTVLRKPGGLWCFTRRERCETVYGVVATLSRNGRETGTDCNGRGTTEGKRPAVGRLNLVFGTTRVGKSTGDP
jgi:hypothetical protein